MRLCERNKQELWFANRLEETMVTDANGLKTGEKRQSYGEPQQARMAISASSGANNLGSQGMAELSPYGIGTGYTHNAVTEDLDCPMDEESVVWLGRTPTQTVRITEMVDGELVTGEKVINIPYNYRVVRKAESLNHLIYYLKEVDVT